MSQLQTDPYAFQRFSDYLKALIQSSKRPPSLTAMARRLGYRSPRLIAMILKGQRIPSMEFVTRFTEAYQLNWRERRYLELIVLRERQETRGLYLSASLGEELQALREPHKLCGLSEPKNE